MWPLLNLVAAFLSENGTITDHQGKFFGAGRITRWKGMYQKFGEPFHHAFVGWNEGKEAMPSCFSGKVTSVCTMKDFLAC